MTNIPSKRDLYTYLMSSILRRIGFVVKSSSVKLEFTPGIPRFWRVDFSATASSAMRTMRESKNMVIGFLFLFLLQISKRF